MINLARCCCSIRGFEGFIDFIDIIDGELTFQFEHLGWDARILLNFHRRKSFFLYARVFLNLYDRLLLHR